MPITQEYKINHEEETYELKEDHHELSIIRPNYSLRSDYIMITDQIVKSMTDNIINNFSPDKIVVFGSWARNDYNEHSDVDFLVIMPYSGSKRDAQVAVRRVLKGFGVPKDVIVATKQEIEQRQNLSGYIYGAALREGRVVYERVAE